MLDCVDFVYLESILAVFSICAYGLEYTTIDVICQF